MLKGVVAERLGLARPFGIHLWSLRFRSNGPYIAGSLLIPPRYTLTGEPRGYGGETGIGSPPFGGSPLVTLFPVERSLHCQ